MKAIRPLTLGWRVYSTDVLVGRCGWRAQTVNLLKSESSNFLTLSMMGSLPCLWQTAVLNATEVSANTKLVKN